MQNVSHITSRQNPLLVQLRRLARDPAGYRTQGQMWLDGEHLCRAYADSGRAVAQAVLTDAAWATPIGQDLARRAAAIAVVPESVMASLSPLESPAPIAYAVAAPAAGRVQAQVPSVVLDRLQDAGNVGTMLRTAAAFGFRQVLALEGTAGLYAPKVLRAGMGAHFALNLVEGIDASALALLRVPLFATDPGAAVCVHDLSLPWPCAWVFGHEGQGVDRALAARCDGVVRIPQPGGENSLNVSAAAAVCLYESMRQRAMSGVSQPARTR